MSKDLRGKRPIERTKARRWESRTIEETRDGYGKQISCFGTKTISSHSGM